MKIRTRMAPSPTGNLHIGTARTTLFNWLFARHHGGEFILRIEDTDLERSEKEYEDNIIEGLTALGLNWDNARIYHQSERLDIYEDYLKKLLNSGKAFWCRHTVAELEDERKNQESRKEPPRHLCEHKKERYEDGEIIRLAVDTDSDRKISFNDIIRGEIEFEEKLLGDFSLAKNLRTPLYNFAVVVDDVEMEISHVIRGEDHISNTPKQILIYEALEAKQPAFAHLPMILGEDRTKLSKRHGATAVSDYLKDYLPETLINFMGLLGYTYSKEILSREEMAGEFELEKVHKAGAIFDIKKLNWMNAQYIRNLPAGDFKKIVGKEFLSDEAVAVITERLERLSDIEEFSYLWQEPQYDAGLLKWKNYSLEDAKMALKEIADGLESLDTSNVDGLKKFLDEIAQKISDKIQLSKMDRGLAYWPLRVALSGKERSPDPVSLIKVLGMEGVRQRINEAIKK